MIIWNNILKHILCPFIRQLVGIDKLHFNLMSSWGKPDTKKFICLGEKINSVFFCLFTNFPFFSFSLSLLFSHSLCLLPHLSVYVSTFTQYFVYHLFSVCVSVFFSPSSEKANKCPAVMSTNKIHLNLPTSKMILIFVLWSILFFLRWKLIICLKKV